MVIPDTVKKILVGTALMVTGWVGNQLWDYSGVPGELRELNGKIHEIEEERKLDKEEQKIRDDKQDVEIRTTTSEINGLKLEITALRAETNTNTKLLQEVREDVKKILNRQ